MKIICNNEELIFAETFFDANNNTTFNLHENFKDEFKLMQKYSKCEIVYEFLDSIFDQETLINFTKILNVFFMIKPKISYEYFLNNLFPKLRKLPSENDKLFFNIFTTESGYYWINILNFIQLVNKAEPQKFLLIYYNWIVFHLIENTPVWNILIQNKAFENLPSDILDTIWTNNIKVGITSKLDIIKRDIGRFDPSLIFCPFIKETSKIWITENYIEILQSLGLTKPPQVNFLSNDEAKQIGLP